MPQRPADLPEFQYPPLVEVVLSVQFSELRNYQTVHAGLLWDRTFRQSYPKVSEHPPLSSVFETFGIPQARSPRLQISQTAGMPMPRLWFVNKADTELIQLQADRFTHNWRKTAGSGDYPRYEAIKERFCDELSKLNAFFEQESLGNIEPNQCEVTYVNHITLRQSDNFNIWEKPEVALRVLSSTTENASDPAARLPRREDSRYSARYIIQDSKGVPIGRLLVSSQPALAPNQEPVLRLDLTARGAPASTTLDAVSDFLDLGRETIVRGFTAITTSEMHQRWQRVR
jgi:uncharacterized protein (TIGR04255 family)